MPEPRGLLVARETGAGEFIDGLTETDMALSAQAFCRCRDFGVEPPVALLLQGATLADLAVELGRALNLTGPAASAPTSGVAERAKQRAAARQRAANRRKVGQ